MARKTRTPESTPAERAFERAHAEGGASHVSDNGGDTYSCLGRKGDVYRLAILTGPSGRRYTCDCPAGREGRCCWHKAAVHLFRAGVPSPALVAAPEPRMAPAKWFLWDYPNEPGFEEWTDSSLAQVPTQALRTIATARIIPGANDRRGFNAEALQALADDILTNGLLQPPTVRPLPDGRYQLVAGERRWRACTLAGLTEIPAFVRELDDKQAAAAMLAENELRVDLNPIERARGYQARLDAGWTIKELAQTGGVTPETIRARLKLLGLRADLQAMVANGTLPVSYAQTLAAYGLDENRQLIAIRRYQENPAPNATWFSRECAELAREQAEQPFDFMLQVQMAPEPTATPVTPPVPGKDKPPTEGASVNDTLRRQITFWHDAADAWDRLGKVAKRDQCLAAAGVLESTLAMLDAAPAPIQPGGAPIMELFTAEQAAVYLGISLATLRYHVRERNIEYMTFGKSLAFAKDHLDAFKANKRAPGNPNWKQPSGEQS